MKRKLRGKNLNFEWIKNEVYQIWSEIDLSTIKKILMSIYNRIGDCIEMEGKLTNYKKLRFTHIFYIINIF